MGTSADRIDGTTDPDAAADSGRPAERAGSDFGRYRIEALLGEGGMGQVYRALDTVLRRPVALKLLHARQTGDERSAARLLREARAAAALSHPNAVAVFDVGEVDGVTFIAMELLHGHTLRSFVTDARVAIVRKVRWMLQVARALDAAHRAGLMHRDVKPENILVCEDDVIKVLDFGLAKRKSGPPDFELPQSPVLEGPVSFKTQEGRVCGTPRYMAPEQLLGSPTEQSDQFSWGLVAYELFTGQAFDDLEPKAPHELRPDVPLSLSAIVLRAMDPNPSRRYPTMKEVVAQVEREDVHLASSPALAPTIESPGSGSDHAAASDDQTTVANAARRPPAPSPASLEPVATHGRSRFPAIAIAVVGVAALGAGGLVVARQGTGATSAPPAEAPPACLPGTYWDGNMCALAIDAKCPAGKRFESAIGCVVPTLADEATPPRPCLAGMASVPGGSFLPPNANAVITVRPFCMDATEVTASAYADCVRAKGCSEAHADEVRGPDPVPLIGDPRCNLHAAGKGSHPMNCVDWKEADTYCRAQNKRLPAPEEWIWAARGGDRATPYPWGTAAPRDQICWSGVTRRDGTCPVGSFSAGDAPGGLHDLSGNVWEFVAPTGTPAPGTLLSYGARIFAGGAWSHSYAPNMLALALNWGAEDVRAADIGFRCAL